MNARRLLALVILIAFLPAATGCSASRTIRLDEDPADNETATRSRSGEAIEVNGYTRPDDGFRSWRGFVQTVPPDSLAFESRPPDGIASVTFRLARTDVISIDAREFSAAGTTVLVSACLLAAGLAVMAYIGHQLNQDFGN